MSKNPENDEVQEDTSGLARVHARRLEGDNYGKDKSVVTGEICHLFVMVSIVGSRSFCDM